MGCGCKVKREPGCTPIAVRAAVCHTCMWAEHDSADPWGAGAVSCSESGRAVTLHVMGVPCPRGKHPDGSGVTRWAWARWYGLAFPLRVWLWLTHPSHRRPEWWIGCGCSVLLKGLWVRISGRQEIAHADGHEV